MRDMAHSIGVESGGRDRSVRYSDERVGTRKRFFNMGIRHPPTVPMGVSAPRVLWCLAMLVARLPSASSCCVRPTASDTFEMASRNLRRMAKCASDETSASSFLKEADLIMGSPEFQNATRASVSDVSHLPVLASAPHTLYQLQELHRRCRRERFWIRSMTAKAKSFKESGMRRS